MNPLHLFRRRRSIKVISSSSLRLSDWRASEHLVAEARRLLADPAFKLLMAVLHNESPVNFGLPDLGVSETDRAATQSRTEGYHLCLNNLEAAATLDRAAVPLEATFEPEQPPPDTSTDD